MIPFARILSFNNVLVGPEKIASMVASDTAFFILTDTGKLYGSGGNSNSQIGIGGAGAYYGIYSQISTDVHSVFALQSTTVIVKTDGTVWYKGRPTPFLPGNYTNTSSWVEITTLVKAVVADTLNMKVYGSNSNVFVLSGTTLYSMGETGFGSSGSQYDYPYFQQIRTDVKDVYVVPSAYCTFAVLTNNTLVGCGRNGNSELGTGNTTRYNAFTPIPLSNIGIKSFSSCNASSVMIRSDNTMYIWGNRQFGQLGDGYSDSASSIHSYPVLMTTAPFPASSVLDYGNTYVGANAFRLLRVGNELYGTGLGNVGQLSLDTLVNVSAFTKATLPDGILLDNFKMIRMNNVLFLYNEDTIYASGNSLFIVNAPTPSYPLKNMNLPT